MPYRKGDASSARPEAETVSCDACCRCVVDGLFHSNQGVKRYRVVGSVVRQQAHDFEMRVAGRKIFWKVDIEEEFGVLLSDDKREVFAFGTLISTAIFT